jgi:exopolysaccharide production protein ExoQ
MRAFGLEATSGPSVNWRMVECWGAAIALFLQSGAIFPLLLANADGGLDDPARAKLRLLSIPVYAFTGLIAARHFPQFVTALKRNPFLPMLLALSLLSVMWSVSPSTTLLRSVGLMFTLLLAYVFAIRFTSRQLLLLAFATFGTSIALSLAMYFVLPDLARMPDEGTMRGIFIHKNVLGWYASLSMLTASAVLFDGSLGLKRIAFILLVASGICLFASGSMTAMIATGSAYCLFGFYSVLRRTVGVTRIVVIMIFVQLAIVLLSLLHEFLVPALEALGKDATLTGRVPLWELVDREIASRLLFGFGYQSFWTEGNPDAWYVWSEISWQAPHAHNGYRDTMLSFGIVGTAFFIFVIMRAIWQGAVLHCRDAGTGWLWLNVYLVMVLVMNLTESMFLIPNDTIFLLFATTIVMFSLYAPAVLPRPLPRYRWLIGDVSPEVHGS